jgi:hypothetical protein
LKFKGKRKAQLIELLEANSVSADDSVFEEDIATLPVKRLREKCKEIGLSVYGTKAELILRLKSSSNEAVSIPVVQWRERGRRMPMRPSETEEKQLKAGMSFKEISRLWEHESSGQKLEENVVLNDDIDKNTSTPEKLCESCEENPYKLHKTTAAKWFCQECKEHICTLCKEAHEKIRITRTHSIVPFGTILDFNIDNDLTVMNVSILPDDINQGLKS